MSLSLRSAATAALLCLFSSLLPAQVLNGRLEIVVNDSSGALVAGAKVSLKDLRRKSSFGTPLNTDSAGVALFASVVPSEYEITVEASGFRKSVVSGVELNASQTIRQVIGLEVGAVSESISVEANAVNVNVSDATIARTVNMKSIDTLPQLGRSPLSLVAFVPGASVDPSDPTFTRINGARQGSNNSRLDGIDVNDAVVPRLGLSMTAVNTDSLEEVRIITNGGKAEYGRNAGGQVEMVTRSGGNQYHGSAFNFLRNTVLNANNWFNNASGTKRPVFIQNIFGGQMGGPILKDKLFFFGNFQGRRTTQGVVRNRTVLTASAKQGIYTWTGGTFNIGANDPNGRGIDPKMKELMALMPNPNNNDVGDGFNTGGFRFNVAAPGLEYQGTGKVDYNLKPNHRVFFRYSRQFNESIDSLNSAEQRYPGLPDGKQGGVRWGWGAGSDWTINSTTVNEFRIGRQSASVDFIRPYRDGGVAVLSNLYDDPINSALGQGRNSPVVDMTDNISFLKGKHTYKVGFTFRRVLQYGYNFGGIYPNVNLTRTSAGNAPAATFGPQGLTSANRQIFEGLFNDVLGRVGNVTQTFYSDLVTFQDAGSPRVRNTVFKDMGIFFQDDWKIRSNLTLNVGLRWENFGVPKELNGFQGSLDRVADLNTSANISNTVIKKTDSWYKNDFNNFAPRFGFAYDVFKNGKTVVRGNWGIFFDRIIGATSSAVDGNTPGFAQATQTFPNGAGGTIRTVSNLAASDLPIKPGAPVTSLPLNRNTTITVFNPNLRTGYLQQINFGISHQIAKNTVLDTGFVRTAGTKLFTWQDINQPRIYGDFLNSFRELAAFSANGTAVGGNNTLARLFGGAGAAVTALGATNLAQGLAGTVADNLDRTASNYNRYAGAGVSDFYLRNYPQYNQVQYGSNAGSSSYNSLQMTVSHRTRNALAILNYTFSKSIDNASVDGNGFTAPVDNYNFVNNRGRSDFDRPHAINFSGSYTLPFGKGQRYMSGANGFVNRIVGDWTIGGLAIVQSGTVFSVTSARRTLGSTLNTYANYSGDRNIGEVLKDGRGVQYFSAAQVAAFTFPGAGEIGNSGRNAFRGPKFFNTDASIVKPIPITERIKMQFRAEAYNLLNRANFTTPGTSILTPSTFGRLSATANTSSGTGARVMQMALRVDF
ncbi:MAG: TonB-dependent receptor [Acidobacteria bacterium]|nr:TonB-dependent receptor [Acidobacteriota bacterium]